MSNITTGMMAPAAARAVGAGLAPRKADRNDNGLTYREWLDTAGVESKPRYYAMWQGNKNPVTALATAKDNPLSGSSEWSLQTKVLVGAGAFVGLIGIAYGGLYLYKKQQAKPRWRRSPDGTIPAGAKARVSVDASVVASLFPGITIGQFGALLIQARMLSGATVWAGNDPALPGDWPKDDANKASEFHASFTNAGAVPLNINGGIVGVLPGLPFLVWIFA